MKQMFRLLWATLFTLYVSSALAVGMGELELNSALNQQFDARVPLTKVGNLGPNEMIPNLASQADFNRVGVERNYDLTDLRFKVENTPDGQYYIHITSGRPIIEPFLNFIVEVIWPTGRILREYTVLLDPPVFGTQGIEKINPATTSGTGPSTQSPVPSTSSPRKVPPAPSVSSGRSEGVVTEDDEYGLTGPGDTLWTIAMKVRPNQSVSVQQTMLALKRANPEAFINNNINLLKAGHVLRIPDVSEIQSASPGEAIAAVRQENEAYADYRAGGSDVTQLDARRTANRQSGGAQGEEDDGELKLLASDRSGARAGADDARAAELEDALSVAREDLDRARRANTEMNVRMDDLSGQIETLNDIVKLKDDQLAALRAELQKSMSAPQPQAATPAASQPAQAGLFSNPMILGGLGLLLIVILAAAAMVVMRKRREAASEEDEDFPGVMLDEPEIVNDEAEPVEAPPEVAEEEEDVTQQTSDVIGEAEIYIAYGRFPQAISFLQNAIAKEPERADIQLKLLEVYVQTEDATAFNLQLEQLKALGDADATARAEEMQAQIPGAAETAAAAMDATVVSAEPIEAIAEPADDDDDDELSFDLDDLDAETEDEDLDLSLDDEAATDDLSLEDTEELSLDEAIELGDADLDLDLDAALEEAATADDAADDSEELDLDLDLDDEIDLEFDDETSDNLDATQQLDATEEIDLDLDMDDDTPLSADNDQVAAGSDGLDLDDDGAIELDLGDDDELDLGDLDDDALDLGTDDDEIELDLGDDDDALDLGDDDDALDLGDDDDALELDLDGDDDLELDLGDDGAIELDLDDDDELDLGDLDDDLNLDEDAGSKLDLARAYIEMGDSEGAKALLNEVTTEGSDEEISQANELLSSLD